MSASEEIFAKLARVLSESLGVDGDQVIPSATLQGDLGAESIDFLDIVYRLEREFRIKIPRGELFPDAILGGSPEFGRDGRVTDEGMAQILASMPFADLGAFQQDRRLSSVADLFTVDLVARYLGWKLGQHVPVATDALVGHETPPAR